MDIICFESFNCAAEILADDKNNFLMVHSGKIRGGKETFWDIYKGDTIQLKTKKGSRNIALVGVMNSPDYSCQLLGFVKEVNRIKKIVSKKKVRI